MYQPKEYYYVLKQGRWELFAILSDDVKLCSHLTYNPIAGRETDQNIVTLDRYNTNRLEFDDFIFLIVKPKKFFQIKAYSHGEKAIRLFSNQLAIWRKKLLDFLISTSVEDEFINIINAAKNVSGTNNLLIGLFARPVESFFFEFPEGNLPYEKRILYISKEQNPNTFNQLYNIEDYSDFFMPSKFGQIRYKAYKLTHRQSFLGVVLFDQDNPSELYPFVQIDEFCQVLSNFLMVVRSKRLYNGIELLNELFESDPFVELKTVNERVKQFLSAKRLPWIDHSCQLISKYLNVDACTVFWLHQEPRLVLAGSTHCKGIQQVFYNLNTLSLTTKCFNSDKPICRLDVGSDKENSHIFDEDIGTLHKSWLGYPIKAKGKRIGILRLLNKRSPIDRLLTHFCGSDIENARLVSNYLAKCYEELTQYAQMYQAEKEAQKLQEEAQRAAERTSRFMKSLTHEIQRPIPSIGGLLEYLELFLVNSSLQQKEQLILKIKDCYSCLDLLQVILDTITNQAGKIKPKPTEINLVEDFLQPLKKMLLQAAKDEKKGFTYIDKTTKRWVTLDKTLTTQILVILLLNAFKYANDYTEVLLIVKDTPDGIEFEVEDIGEVIPSNCVDKIFEWEYRAPSIIEKRYPGAGIGLTLAQTIASALDTKIVVKQREPKTIFAFKIISRGML